MTILLTIALWFIGAVVGAFAALAALTLASALARAVCRRYALARLRELRRHLNHRRRMHAIRRDMTMTRLDRERLKRAAYN